MVHLGEYTKRIECLELVKQAVFLVQKLSRKDMERRLTRQWHSVHRRWKGQPYVLESLQVSLCNCAVRMLDPTCLIGQPDGVHILHIHS